jgi:hypothetical protein
VKVEANTVDEFFAADKRGGDLKTLAELITSETGEEPTLVHGMGSITMLGWRFIDYKPKSAKKSDPYQTWPMIAIAPQKNYLALYICAIKDGKYLTEFYQDKLGKVNCGKSCVRFKKLEDLNLSSVKTMVAETKNLTFGA